MPLKIMQGLYAFVMVFITALIASYITRQGLYPFYDLLIKPEMTPENQFFSIAWTINYILLFISFYLVLRTPKTLEQFDDANALFVCQLFLQILWTFCFFFLHQITASAIVIVLLDMVVALMLHTFLFINLWSFILLLPYLIWILYATYLNVYIAFVN